MQQRDGQLKFHIESGMLTLHELDIMYFTSDGVTSSLCKIHVPKQHVYVNKISIPCKQCKFLAIAMKKTSRLRKIYVPIFTSPKCTCILHQRDVTPSDVKYMISSL